MRRSIAFTVILLLGIVTAARAQSADIQPGTAIRVRLAANPSKPIEGTLSARSGDSLSMLVKGNLGVVRFPASAVRGIEVANGKERFAPALRWGLIGGGIWALASTVFPYDNCAVRHTEYCANSRAQFVATQAIGMSVMSATVGAIRGREQWVTVESSAPTAFVGPSSRGVAAGVRIGL